MSPEKPAPTVEEFVLHPPRSVSSYASLRAIAALILREMSTRYGRSPGGYLWAILEPIGSILILGLAFSLLVRNPPIGTSFFLFYATGYLPFNLYQGLVMTTARSIMFSRPLLKYPTVTWVDALFARFTLNSLTGILVTYLILTGLLLPKNGYAVLEIAPILTALSLAIITSLGFGTLNCAIFGLFPVWEQIWSITTRPLFLASGVLFLYEDMPQSVQSVLWYNPLLHVVGFMREGVYPMYTPTYTSPLYVIGLSITLLFLGLVLLGRYHRDILNR